MLKSKTVLGRGFESLENRLSPSSVLGAESLPFAAAHTSNDNDNLAFAAIQVANQHSNAQDAGTTKDVQNVFQAGNPANVFGESTLMRKPNGISAQVKTTGLTPGNVYTLWFVVFNNPESCEGGCNGPDLIGNPAVNGTLAFGAGAIAAGDGSITLAGYLQEGDTSGYPDDFPIQPLPGADTGLAVGNADGAEIHLVVRDHGQPVPGLVSEQLHTFGGGCDVNVCQDVQVALHFA